MSKAHMTISVDCTYAGKDAVCNNKIDDRDF